ncbi:MAG: hypothetical protein RR075_02890 [Pygmaiobacter sp.]
MTIEDYISEVFSGIEVSPVTEERIRNEIKTRFRTLTEEGKTPEEAVEALGHPELLITELMTEYDDEAHEKSEGEGQISMIWAWGLMLSAILFIIKGSQCLFFADTTFNRIGAGAGLLGLLGSGLYYLWFRNTK